MSIALGWLAVLASFTGAPVPRVDGPSITYQFQVIELRGLEWREGTVHGLKPVASRGGVTIWTAPLDFLKQLPESSGKQVLMAPRLTAYTQTPAHLTTRNNRPFVTQVAWRGETVPPRETTENVREGLTATISGRAIDQGVLAQLVIEDTEIRSVHTLNLPDPAHARLSIEKTPALVCGNALFDNVQSGHEMPNSAQAFCPAACHASTSQVAANQVAWHPSAKEPCCADDEANAEGCHPVQANTSPAEKTRWTPARSAQVQVPEIGRAEIAGEWLIPRDEVLLVGFGPHTIADQDGKAVVRERLAMITATEVAMPAGGPESEPLGLPRPLPKIARPPTALLPSPGLPSRSLPQGIHADGTPADLPPLPDDEKTDQSPGDSSEPHPSPQKHKAQPGAGPTPRPTVDSKAAKATFTLPKGLFNQASLPQLMLPNLQFMMPLKPFELKLPFNQKLELELIGRVVADTEPAIDGSPEE